jgi:hypothetical protein
MTFRGAEFRLRDSYAERGWTGKWLLSCPSDSLLHLRVGFPIKALGDFWIQAGSQLRKRLVLAVEFDLVRRAHIVTLGMVAETISLDDFEMGPLLLSNFIYDQLKVGVEFFRIGGFDFTTLDAKRLPSREHASGQLLLDGSALGPAIVLDHEEDGRAPERGQIESLVD